MMGAGALLATAIPGLSRAAGNRFDAAMAPFAADGFNGVALAGRGGKILWQKPYGVAEARRQVALASRFETGSVSKWIAAITVMALVDAGTVALDTPIIAYLPDYRADSGGRVTLRHLMSHCSGVPNDIDAARKADPQVKLMELDQMEAVRRYASGDLAFAPGTRWDYSHSNWILTKAVAERASGRTYGELVQQFLTEPLGLKDSGLFRGESSATPGMAVAYATLSPPQRKLNGIPDYMAMAGGYYASAGDLFRLMAGVLDGDVLTPASRRTLMQVQMPDQHYALGGRTRVEPIAGQMRETAWEDGSNGGFRLVARRVLADGHTVIVMNNSSFDYMKMGQVADALMAAAYLV
ncbi:hypothetical protein AEAC466_14780 [Asticcacaulis sp. AC466]|nr:hypothetical protein AEAC466_14780 [Asticcacaulis sp. AC466]